MTTLDILHNIATDQHWRVMYDSGKPQCSRSGRDIVWIKESAIGLYNEVHVTLTHEGNVLFARQIFNHGMKAWVDGHHHTPMVALREVMRFF